MHRTEGKSLTLGDGDFTYSRLSDLLLGGEWAVPPLARHGIDDLGDMALVAAAMSRGNSKTDGWKSRIVKVPAKLAPKLWTQQAQDLSAEQRIFQRR